jgi:3-oxoacyl-[acyl-carrier protein] reductase
MRGRVAFVTGAAQGIGRGCALALAEAGARLALADVNQEKLDGVAKEIEAAGSEAISLLMNVADAAQVEAAFRKASERFEKVDILVNNAGIARDRLLIRMKREDWDTVLAVNLTGAYLCTQQALPGMMKQRYGRIVNVASVVARMGNAGQANYIASKAGIIGLTKAIAQEVASRNITVNAVAPGFIATAMTEKLNEQARERLMQRVPLGRMGTDRDVAVAVRFLASEEAGYITGHVLDVNGGMYMS